MRISLSDNFLKLNFQPLNTDAITAIVQNNIMDNSRSGLKGLKKRGKKNFMSQGLSGGLDVLLWGLRKSMEFFRKIVQTFFYEILVWT
jgi:hypothetical protein